MKHLDKNITKYLSIKLNQAEATIRKNISLLAHEYPQVTPNGRAQIYAKKNGATVWGKLKTEDRQSLPNIEIQRDKIRVIQKNKVNNKEKKIITLINYTTNDPFRKGHIDEINRAYTFKCYTSAFILCRKVLENMIVDILRKKFPETSKENKELYFDTGQKRFKDFRIILKNFRDRSTDFGSDKKLVERIVELADGLKDKANDKAHSWYHLVRKPKELEDLDIQNIIDMIKTLETSLEI